MLMSPNKTARGTPTDHRNDGVAAESQVSQLNRRMGNLRPRPLGSSHPNLFS